MDRIFCERLKYREFLDRKIDIAPTGDWSVNR